MERNKVALVTGATGLVGKAIIRLLLDRDYYAKIIVLTRRELEIKDNRMEVILLDDFGQMETVKDRLNAHHVYCALGTTMSKAKSKEIFLKIDYDYPIQLAKLVKDQPNFEQFLMVTSVGANPSSPLFYNRTKGQVEEELIKLEMKSLQIFQPSLLIGYRDEFRFWEEVSKFFSSLLSFFVIGHKTRLWTIRGTEVANAMFNVARRGSTGVAKFSPNKMIQLAYF
jgi:uncharacterized protein YbjT (DUF2867 family)